MARRVRKAEDKIRLIRYASIGFVALVAVLTVAVGLIYGTGTGGEIAEDDHYRLIEGARASRARTVEVVEYFSYTCVLCRNFEPMLEDWQEALPEGASFRRAHVGFSGGAEILARAHVVLGQQQALEANHQRLFRAIHDRNRQFTGRQQLADFVDGYGVERDAFLAAIDQPGVRRAVAAIDRAFRDADLVGVPAMVVAGKYVVNMELGRKQALAVVDQLVREELEARAAEASQGEATGHTRGRVN